LTADQRKNILNDHNIQRSKPSNAANMLELIWDPILENVAQNYLDHLSGGGFQHNSNRGCDYIHLGGRNFDPNQVQSNGCPWIAENWYSGGPDNKTGQGAEVLGGAVSAWTTGRCNGWYCCPMKCSSQGCSEQDNFYQISSSCSQHSGQYLHYTAVMNAETEYVGCGYSAAHGTLCDYSKRGGNWNLPPSGQVQESNIWHVGQPCSACPSSHSHCLGGKLCSSSSNPGPPGPPAPTPGPPSPDCPPCVCSRLDL
jgi:hypothetical protein